MKANELMAGFKYIPQYENLYSIDMKGNVFSHISGKMLKPYPNHRGYLMVDLYKYGNAKKVIQCDKKGETIKVWACISDASRELGIGRCSISNCIKGLSKTAGGFIWKL